ncbi:hypothetical protein L209DRAFT_672812, partial [Thermothelomyces heterothallicus CBS 203.75]
RAKVSPPVQVPTGVLPIILSGHSYLFFLVIGLIKFFYRLLGNLKMLRNTDSPYIKHLTNEDKLRIYTLYYNAKKGLSEIVALTGFTKIQIRGIIRSRTTTVTKRSSRLYSLTKEEEKELITFITGSYKGRRIPFL